MKKINKKIFCDTCESDFSVNFWEADVKGPVLHCPFCGESLDEDYTEEEVIDDEELDLGDEEE